MIFKVINGSIWIKLYKNEKIWDVKKSCHTSEKKGDWENITPLSGRYLQIEVLNMELFTKTIIYLHKNGTVIVQTKDSPDERQKNEKSYRRSLIPPSIWDKRNEDPTYL